MVTMLGVDSRIVFEERLAPCVTFDLQKNEKNVPGIPDPFNRKLF